MEDLFIEQKALKGQLVSTMLDFSIADIKEAAELDRIDFETLIEEIRVN